MQWTTGLGERKSYTCCNLQDQCLCSWSRWEKVAPSTLDVGTAWALESDLGNLGKHTLPTV